MRGKAPIFFASSVIDRITPAYAGKSIGKPSAATTTQDHPRLCGEKHTDPDAIFRNQGSPPPMRGKDCIYFRSAVDNGITPAYAGKSRSVRHSGILTQDHPRLCGEKAFFLMNSVSETGSPPPMRGKDTP